MTAYPEINALSLRDAQAAYRLGYVNYPALAPEFRDEFNKRMSALRDRIRRLKATAKRGTR